MAKRNGGIIGPDNVPAGPLGAAKGVWRIEDAFNYQKAGLWPTVLGYQVPNSLRFNSGSSDFLNRTPSSTTNRQIFTISVWLKRSSLGLSQILCNIQSDNDVFFTQFSGTDTIQFGANSGGVSQTLLETSAVYRDVSAWYHVVFSIDTTQATSSNRMKLYINGSQVTAFGTANYPTQNANLHYNVTQPVRIGNYNTSQFFGGYMSEIYSIDGQALTPSSFGASNASGVWYPIPYTGTYGTNGFNLKFGNSASLGTDSSSNGNNFTVNNFTSLDQSTDSTLNNFCTINSLDNYYASDTITEGNLKISTSVSAYAYITSTIAVSKGKWYCEYKINTASATDHINGIASQLATSSTQSVGTQSGSIGYKGNGDKAVNGTSSAYGNSLAAGDIVGIALDLDNNFVYFSKNGTFQNSGVPTSGSSGTGGIAITAPASTQDGVYYFAFGDNANLAGGSYIFDLNFGSPLYAANSYTDANGFGNFSYAVPSGYYSLCSKNLAIYG